MKKGKSKYLYTTLFFVFICFMGFSQTKSLEERLGQVEGDEKFELLLTISKEYWFTNPVKSVEFAQEAFNIVAESGDNILKARALNRIANGYYFLQQFKLALEYYIKSLELCEISDYNAGIAKASNNIGLIYNVLGDYDMALEYYHKSLEIERKAGNSTGVMNTILNIGNIYNLLEDYNKALSYYFEAVEIAKETNDIKGLQNSYNNIGSTYSDINNPDSALVYTIKAYQLSLELNDKDNQASTLNNLGKIYFDKRDFTKALELYNSALKLERELEDFWSEANTLRNIGGLHLMMEDIDNALYHFNKALVIAKGIEAKRLVMNLYNDISEAYEHKNNFLKAFQYKKLSSELNDSIYNDESNKQIIEIEAKYDFRNKDQQLQLIIKDNEVKSLKIKTQKYIIYIIASLSLLILALVFVFYSRSITNKRARILLEEKNTRITEQKILLEKTISELKESEEKQKSLVENILDGIFIIQNNRLIYINEAVVNITGYSIKELHSLSFWDIIADEDLEMIIRNHKARLKGEDVPNSYEFRLKHKNGNIIYLILSVGLINYHGEKAILGTLKDITKQKVYQDEIIKEKEKAEQATLSKSMFLAGMSHEIRNHMSSIIGIAEMLSETKLSKDQQEYVDVINVSGSNLLNIINEILDFSKIEAGQVLLEQSDFLLEDIVNEAISIHELKARKSGLYLKSEISRDIPKKLKGDPMRLSQILINFISNALKFTDKGGIIVKVEICDKHNFKDNPGQYILKFSVIDTGIGISKDSQKKLFKPFSQTHAAVQRKKGGTGLGLAICKQLVEMMDGEIGIESDVGKGSAFWFNARLSDPDYVEEQIVESIDKTDVVQVKDIKVLLVEDNILNQQLTTNILVKEGYITDVAENGKVGLELYKKNKYDVVLMDIQMPVMDGIQATRLIREYEANNGSKKVKIIAVTAYSKEGEKQKLFDAGMDDYLSKPFTNKELINVVES